MIVYGQTEVTRDLMDARAASGAQSVYEAEDVDRARLRRRPPARCATAQDGAAHELDCDFIAGCDGFHGVCRAERPGAARSARYERVYPFGWLGVLADDAAGVARS